MGAKPSIASDRHASSCNCSDCFLKGFSDPIDGIFEDFVPFEPDQCTDPLLIGLFEEFSTADDNFEELANLVIKKLDSMRQINHGSTLSTTDRQCWFLLTKISLMGVEELSLKQRLTLRQAVRTLRISTGTAHQASLDFSSNSVVMEMSRWPRLLNADPIYILQNDQLLEKEHITAAEAISMGKLLRRGASCIRLPLLQRAYSAFQSALPFLLPVVGHEAAFVRTCSAISSSDSSANKYLNLAIMARIGPAGTALFMRLMANRQLKGNSRTACLLGIIPLSSLCFDSPQILAPLPWLSVFVLPFMVCQQFKVLDSLPIDRFLLASKIIWPQYQQQLKMDDGVRQIELESLETLQSNFLKVILHGLSSSNGSEAKLRLFEQLILWLPEGLGCRDVAFAWTRECPDDTLAYTLLQHLIEIDTFCVPPKKRGEKKAPKPRYTEDIGSLVLSKADHQMQYMFVQLRNSAYAKDRIAKYREVMRTLVERNPQLARHKVNTIMHRLSDRESIKQAIVGDIFKTCSIQGSNLTYLEPVLLAVLAGNEQPCRPAERTPAKRPSSSRMQTKPSKRRQVQTSPQTSSSSENLPSSSQRTSSLPPLDLHAGADLTEEVSSPSPQRPQASVQLPTTEKRKITNELDGCPPAKVPRIETDQGGASLIPQLQDEQPLAPPLQQPSLPVTVPVVQPALSSSIDDYELALTLTKPRKVYPRAKSGHKSGQSSSILRPAVLQLPPVASTAGPSSAPDLLTMSAAPSPSIDLPHPDQDHYLLTSPVPSPQLSASPSSSARTETTPFQQRSIQLNLLRPVVVLEHLVLPDAPADVATITGPAQPKVRRSGRLALKVYAGTPVASPRKILPKMPQRKASQQTPKQKAPKRLKRVVVPAAAKVAPVTDLPEMNENETNLAGRPMRKAAYKGNMLMKFICNAETNLWQKRRQPNMSDFLPGKFFRNR